MEEGHCEVGRWLTLWKINLKDQQCWMQKELLDEFYQRHLGVCVHSEKCSGRGSDAEQVQCIGLLYVWMPWLRSQLVRGYLIQALLFRGQDLMQCYPRSAKKAQVQH